MSGLNKYTKTILDKYFENVKYSLCHTSLCVFVYRDTADPFSTLFYYYKEKYDTTFDVGDELRYLIIDILNIRKNNADKLIKEYVNEYLILPEKN